MVQFPLMVRMVHLAVMVVLVMQQMTAAPTVAMDVMNAHSLVDLVPVLVQVEVPEVEYSSSALD
jgi:hypothetical protein